MTIELSSHLKTRIIDEIVHNDGMFVRIESAGNARDQSFEIDGNFRVVLRP